VTAAPDPDADARVNRELWTVVNRQHTDADAERAWTAEEVTWGLFRVREADLGALGDVSDLDVVELGCGSAYLSAWLARRGARPVGVDVTPAQLETAARCQRRFGPAFPLVEADAGAVPLPTDGFDLAVSEYGASVWCDPARWLSEAARLLRPGGRLVFLTNSVTSTLCVPTASGHAGDRLLRPQRSVYRVHWPDGGVEFHPGHGDWVRLLTEALHELYAPEGATTPDYYEIATADWAGRWPVEDLWVARRAAAPD
jgi:SAM-dependent methyltransferase